mmetsp:Transcript_68880/g.190676  ORF Transcript_68880/g.190676 Transcript_68880/m.190676 type:complete len:89 (-) Transcript_68880:99-365(-)
MCGVGKCNLCCSAVCAYLVPPVGVYWRFGCGLKLAICVALTLCGWIPGFIYAVIMIGYEPPAREAVQLSGGGGGVALRTLGPAPGGEP